MSKIRVKHFGPIKEGCPNNKWIDIKKTTIFIGNQGSGKSTVAKLISTLTWIEKALTRGDFNENDLIKYNRLKKYFAYQNLNDYFKDNTVIEYVGKAYSISYDKGTVWVENLNSKNYAFPKIMYVPSERNFTSSVRNVRTLKGLPSTLYTFSDEFVDALEDLQGQISLPINNVKLEYQKLNKISWIVGDNYKIRLSDSSSGFQSLVPLFVVSEYLAKSLGKEDKGNIKNISIDEERRIRKEIERILSNPNISSDIKLSSLEFLSSKFVYSSFVNIVEEPEQNLFPSSQNSILNTLFECNNMKEENYLVMTTHSPYIINYVSIAIQAGLILDKVKSEELKEKLNSVVPIKSILKGKDVVIYQLDEKNGSINILPVFEGIPSDHNFLNDSLSTGNKMFDTLLEIEQEL